MKGWESDYARTSWKPMPQYQKKHDGVVSSVIILIYVICIIYNSQPGFVINATINEMKIKFEKNK